MVKKPLTDWLTNIVTDLLAGLPSPPLPNHIPYWSFRSFTLVSSKPSVTTVDPVEAETSAATCDHKLLKFGIISSSFRFLASFATPQMYRINSTRYTVDSLRPTISQLGDDVDRISEKNKSWSVVAAAETPWTVLHPLALDRLRVWGLWDMWAERRTFRRSERISLSRDPTSLGEFWAWSLEGGVFVPRGRNSERKKLRGEDIKRRRSKERGPSPEEGFDDFAPET
jgi:hypothetical protein